MTTLSHRLLLVCLLLPSMPSALAVPALADGVAAALDHESASIRRAGIQELVRQGKADATGRLLDQLSRPEPDPDLRGAIYAGLGDLGSPDATDTLTTCLAEEATDDLRGTCARALGNLGVAAAVPALLKASADPSSAIRIAAVGALAAFPQDDAVDHLAALLASDEGALRRQAIQSLGRGGSPRAVPHLMDAFWAAAAPKDRLLPAAALARIGAEESAGALSAARDSEDPEVRAFGIIGLSVAGRGPLVGLAPLLGHPEGRVRAQAASELRRRGAVETVPALRGYAARIAAKLGSLPDEALLENAAIVALELSILEEVLRGLVEISPEGGFGVLLGAAEARPLPRRSGVALELESGIRQVRQVALLGLGRVDEPRARAMLAGENGLGDPDPAIRLIALRGLADLAGANAPGLILPLLDDPAAPLRREAALALAFLGDAAALPALDVLLETERHPAVREAAAFAREALRAGN